MKNLKFYIMIFISLVILILFELSQPKEIDWTENYTKSSKIPYGGYIVHSLLPEIFKSGKIIESETELYRTLRNKDYRNTNLIIINNTFQPDKYDLKELLKFTEKSNNVFIAANIFSKELTDTLNIKISYSFLNDSTSTYKLNFAAGCGDIKINKRPYSYYFEKYDTANTQILGISTDGRPNFISHKFGKGKIFIHTDPIVFTNFTAVDTVNNIYLFAVLSHLPDQQVIWDDYYKAGKINISTPIRYILKDSSFRWAYYVAITAVLLFILFQGKRKQRIVPVYRAPENTTVKFVETVSNLYYQSGSNKNITEKKIAYFYEFLRNKFFIDTNLPAAELIEAVSLKTGVGTEETRSIFSNISEIQKKQNITKNELIIFFGEIENFIKKIKE